MSGDLSNGGSLKVWVDGILHEKDSSGNIGGLINGNFDAVTNWDNAVDFILCTPYTSPLSHTGTFKHNIIDPIGGVSGQPGIKASGYNNPNPREIPVFVTNADSGMTDAQCNSYNWTGDAWGGEMNAIWHYIGFSDKHYNTWE